MAVRSITAWGGSALPPTPTGPLFVEHYGGGGGYHNLMRLYPDARGRRRRHGEQHGSYDVDTLIDAVAAPWLER